MWVSWLHDWYLSVNLNLKGDSLDDHLLPGLNPKGVPKNLKDTVFPFEYNNFDQLLSIVSQNDIGVIKMEVTRSIPPENNFLKKIRDLANKKNIVLIFDECSSGFRETFGGIHKKYNVEPDIAMYGKTLGNGYAITAVVGRRSVMENAQETFISSTFWTERIGPTAALKTLEVMENEKSWEQITNKGLLIQREWGKIAKRQKIEIEINGIPALSTFKFNHINSLEFKTYLTQEFLTKGFLATTAFYPSISHSSLILTGYFEILEDIFFNISRCLNEEINIKDLLKYPVAHTGFKRLN